MSIKIDRQRAIRDIISSEVVRSQDELQDILLSQGLNVTQATLSRDFKELGVVKVHDSMKGEYVYRLPGSNPVLVAPDRNAITSDGIRSIEFSGTLAVIKTHPGFASAVATIIDHNITREVVGTLAGDDTVLLVVREGCTHNQLVHSISRFFPGIQSKLI